MRIRSDSRRRKTQVVELHAARLRSRLRVATAYFKATFGGSFGEISFGNVAGPALSREFLLGDLSVVGSLAGGGAWATQT
jgi:hypothetical protein